MKKPSVLTQLALAGIAAGLVSTAPAKATPKDSVKAHKADSAAAHKTDSLKASKHSCRGKNACKGQGGCAMTKKDLEKAAKKQGVAVDKAGKPHSCKGLNECKGLGGCGM